MSKVIGTLHTVLRQMDEMARAASPPCGRCGRPDGGFVPRGMTAWEAGLVDRANCPHDDCPMRANKDG
jgi:hypothetical protein